MIAALTRWRIARFGISGAAATSLHAAVALGLINLLATTPEFANAVAFLTASGVSYTLNTLWTFGAHASPRQGLRFALTASTSSLLAAFVSHLVDRAGAHHVIGILAVIAVVPPITYLLHKHYTYRS